MEQLRHNGTTLAYEEAGRGTPHVVLLPDLGADHTSLQAQLDHFRQRHRAVAVDLPGHRHSDRPEGHYSMASVADDLAWLCYALGLYRPALIGHGLGGLIALEMASRYPDLPGGVVVVETGRPLALTPSPRRGGGTGSLRPAGPAQPSSPLLAGEGLGKRSLFPPVLYIASDIPTVDLAQLQALCPHLSIARVAGVGHSSLLEALDQLNALIDSFLTKCVSAGIASL